MKFKEAFEEMKKGAKVRLPGWAGYWVWDPKAGTIMMRCRDGITSDIRETEFVEYTVSNLLSEEWEIIDEDFDAIPDNPGFMNFGQALEQCVKNGKRITRIGWNGKNMCIAYQPGYPEGIPCNENTAKTWGIEKGSLFKCRPYLQLRCADGTFQMWTASQSDILADDWVIAY